MSYAKTGLRVGGIVVAALGMMFLPIGSYVFRKGDLSVFHNIADLGGFLLVGVALLVVGLIAFGMSFVLKGEMID